jgi:methylthioribose-1-phosphate isomerase
MKFDTVSYKNNKLIIIDQRLLPKRLKKIEARSARDVYNYIRCLAVRGAPAIGVFAAYGLLVGIRQIPTDDKREFFKKLKVVKEYIEKSRPTAVNLSWALNKMLEVAYDNQKKSITAIKKLLENEAESIHKDDMRMCESIGLNGAKLISKNDTVLTHCNAGFLATGGMGTALAAIYRARQQGKNIKVYACETRPLLQGARLTVWELKNAGLDVTLICDNMAASIMKQGKIDKVIVGADRIAVNGDTANKIGTYSLAVLAKVHNIPFYIAAPSSTVDLSIKNGSQIPIEERSPEEIRKMAGVCIAPDGIKVYNPAFDVTPADFITAIITEKGVYKKPYTKKLKRLNV